MRAFPGQQDGFSEILSQADVAAWFMIFVFGLVLGVGLFFIFLVNLHVKKRPLNLRASAVGAGGWRSGGLDWLPLPKQWLVIQSHNLDLLQEQLRFHHPTDGHLVEALSHPSEFRLAMVTIPMGWTVVFGHGLPDPAEDVDVCYHFLKRLSQEFGDVQFFCADKVLLTHGWVSFSLGKVRRAYVWAGMTQWNQGEMTVAERDLEMSCREYGQEPDSAWSQESGKLSRNVDRVYSLSARWGVDLIQLRSRLLVHPERCVVDYPERDKRC